MVSGCLSFSSLFSSDQFVVSVPTEVSGSFNERNFSFFLRSSCGKEGRKGCREGRWPLGERARPESKICEVLWELDFSSPLRLTCGSSQGLVGKLRPSQDNRVLGRTGRTTSRPHLPILICIPLPREEDKFSALGSPPGGPTQDWPPARSPGTKR